MGNCHLEELLDFAGEYNIVGGFIYLLFLYRVIISLYHYITIYLYHYISISLYIYIFIFIPVTIMINCYFILQDYLKYINFFTFATQCSNNLLEKTTMWIVDLRCKTINSCSFLIKVAYCISSDSFLASKVDDYTSIIRLHLLKLPILFQFELLEKSFQLVIID